MLVRRLHRRSGAILLAAVLLRRFGTRPVLIAGTCAFMVAGVVISSVASADSLPVWSAPVLVDHASSPFLGGVVCPSSSMCVAVAAGGPTIRVSPGTVQAGQIVRVYGVVPGCPNGNEVTLISAAFSHAHDFAGLPAVFAHVGAHSAYSVRTRIPAARRAGNYQITGRCGGGNLSVAASLRVLAAPMPCQVPETNRHHIFNVNLDRDRDPERIDVFNFDGGGAAMTGFMVCDRVGGRLIRGQLKYTFTSPGARDSGLRQAWVGDFNRDRRFEIAIRDFITPSAGELLTILRQTSRYARTFGRLQVIAGDQVALHPSARGRATVSVFLKATHTRDGRKHTERWAWSTQRGRWACSSQCGFR